MAKLSPSILSADFGILKEQLELLEKNGVEYIHIDIMDGSFVPNISMGIPVIKSIRKYTNMIFDTHIMIVNPEKYIKQFKEAGCDIINVHAEACENLYETIDNINKLGIKSGVTIKPNTPISDIMNVLDKVSLVLVMTVEPGFGGQKFMYSQLEKVDELVKLRQKNNYKYKIEVDGGININNIQNVVSHGVDLVVAGSAILESDNIEKTVNEFNNILSKF